MIRPALASVAAMSLAACASGNPLPREAGFGPAPALPAPTKALIPTIRVAKATGWPAGGRPIPAPGLAVTPFATGLDHPRWLHVLPNGDVLVAESASPGTEPQKGIRAFFQKQAMKKAGSAVPSANRITLLRDADGNGVAEVKTAFLTGLYSPFGMQLVGETLYVANADALVAFPYRTGQTQIAAQGRKVADLPAGINHHWTKNVIASPDGRRLYVTVGSNSNVAEKGMAIEVNRAAILEVDPTDGQTRLFASGLRNPNGLAWEPVTGALWTAVNERDEIGDDLVPDYITSVKPDGFYGWPYSYWGQHVDVRVKPQRPDLVANAITPDYALGSHTASLGLAFYRDGALPARYRSGAFVGQHGSWNRSAFNGYQVVFIPFAGGKPAGPPEPVLTGFLAGDEARGRPVGVVVDRRGGLLVADDVGDAVWRLTAAGS